jgi:hypothetical protein
MRRSCHALGATGPGQAPADPAPFWLLARSTASAYSHAQWLFTHLEHTGAARIRFDPLGETAVADVVPGVLDAAPDEEILALAAGAGGNPLLLTELLSGLRDEGRIQADSESARLASGQLPKRLVAAVQRWVTALGPRTRRVLAVGAVLGRSFSLDNVAALSDLPGHRTATDRSDRDTARAPGAPHCIPGHPSNARTKVRRQRAQPAARCLAGCTSDPAERGEAAAGRRARWTAGGNWLRWAPSRRCPGWFRVGR